MTKKLILLAAFSMLFLTHSPTVEAAPPKPKYHVVQVVSPEGSVSFEVISSTDYKSRGKELKVAYANAVKAYNADKKANKGKTSLKKPVRPKMKKLKSNMKTEEAAEAACKSFKEKYEKALAKAKAKSPKKKAPKR